MSRRQKQLRQDFDEAEFRSRLLTWYDKQARDLPWRKNRDPYRVWVSEIMLQQTRVAAVIDHYHEFLRRFPTVQKLAAAREASVLAAWSGLGYYRRARMMHAAAKVLSRELRSQFPRTAATLRELPGIGRYTAAAIASIAFGEPVAVVDGNVERVVERLSGDILLHEQTWKVAERLLDRGRPGDFNQAVMELGATVCTPRAPGCLTCPVVELCATRGERPAKARLPRQKKREIHYALDCREGAVLLVQRPKDAKVMAAMWELPELSTRPDPAKPDLTVRHSITVTDYTVYVWRLELRDDSVGQRVTIDLLDRIALTGLARKILRKSGVLCGPHPAQLGASTAQLVSSNL